MQLIGGLHNWQSSGIAGGVVTIGNYDGVHLGHQKILSLVRHQSAELKAPSLVVVFEPQPEEFFTQDKTLRLTSLREKIALLEFYGIEHLLVLPFNANFSQITAEQFIAKILVEALKVRCLIVGDDFVFGCQGQGNFSLLAARAVDCNFQVVEVVSFRIEGMRVSSSLIRAALRSGNFKEATKFLGRSYTITGKVVHGDGLGHSLGFPTANLHLPGREPPFLGIYLVKVYGLTPKPLAALASIGVRPTVFGKDKRFEVYILDFNSDIYGKRITIEFCQKIREEQQFDSLVELQQQIKRDLVVAKEFFQ